MVRSARKVLPGFPHHVTARGNNRRRLFSYASDYRRFLAALTRGMRKSGCTLHQLTLMSNHLHMVTTPPEERALPDLMKVACQEYAQHRNRARNATGKLFEQRYFSDPITSERQLAIVTAYNDTNAFRAGKVTSPEGHVWSTCALHTGHQGISKVPTEIWTPSVWYEELGSNAEERAAAYHEFLQDYLAERAAMEAAELLSKTEVLSTARYTRRLERPDRTRATESRPRYRPQSARLGLFMY